MFKEKICVKVSYAGVLISISPERNLLYKDLLKIVMKRFKISPEEMKFLELYDDEGYKFDKDSFEYFITIFPVPKRIFCIKINYNKIVIEQNDFTIGTSMVKIVGSADKKPTYFATSKQTNNKRKRFCGAPLVRQNCFIGEYPKSSPTEKCVKNIDYQISKRRRLNVKRPKSLRV